MKYLAALFALFILVVIVLADMDRLGFLAFVYDFPMGDKAGHFILYGILSFLVNLTMLRSFRNKFSTRVILSASLLLALAIGLEEWSQGLFPDRTPDWVDLTFSYLGVAAGAWMARRSDCQSDS